MHFFVAKLESLYYIRNEVVFQYAEGTPACERQEFR